MALTPGTRRGPFEVIVALGAGGMREVYRASDARLNRDVALKVLPDAVSADPQRLARFERETKVLAAPYHRHIAHVYGIHHPHLEAAAEHRRALSRKITGEALAKQPMTNDQ